MKPILKQLLTFALLALVMSVSAYAQPGTGHDGWRERVRSQKIAFITSEVGLTPQEAEKFWPVYNQLEEERMKGVMELGRSFSDLEKAIESGVSDKDIEQKLKAYARAQAHQNELDSVPVERFEKVLSKAKIAKLYLAEEKFRRQQINRLHPPKPQPQR